MLSSCDSVSSIPDLLLNACGSDDDDLQAEQTEKGNHRVSVYGWMNRFSHVSKACQFL